MIKLADEWASKSRQVGTIWGDGLVEQSLHTAWYASDWDSIDLDELIMFLPVLLASGGRGERGPARHIRNAIAAHMRSLASSLEQHCDFEDVSERERVMSMICADILRDGVMADPKTNISIGRALSSIKSSTLREYLVYQVAVIITLNRVLRAAEGDCQSTSDCEQADALVASIHSRVNGAYIYPQWAFAHELFSAGAWLGVLLSGRWALLPEFLAEVFAELLERSEVSGAANLVASDLVLLSYIDRTIGRSRLLRQAKRVRETGVPVVIKSKRMRFSPPSAPFVWNGGLFDVVAKRLSTPDWNYAH
ncbi:MAG: hypothetical protein R3D51_16245 [Hyphomicrobiaceae bacterium]